MKQEMTAKQTPLEEILRMYAEDLHGMSGYNQFSKALSQGADEITRLRAELAEARRDAERYRWLRSDDCPFSCYEQEGPDNWGWCPTSSRDLDEAIDAAMAGGE